MSSVITKDLQALRIAELSKGKLVSEVSWRETDAAEYRIDADVQLMAMACVELNAR